MRNIQQFMRFFLPFIFFIYTNPIVGSFGEKKEQANVQVKRKNFDEAINKISLVAEELKKINETRSANILTDFVNVLYYDLSKTNPELITNDLKKKVALGKLKHDKDGIFVASHNYQLPKEILLRVVNVFFALINKIPHDEMHLILNNIDKHFQNNREIGGCILAEAAIINILSKRENNLSDIIQLAKESKTTLQCIGQLGTEIANVIGLLFTYTAEELVDSFSYALKHNFYVFEDLRPFYLDIEKAIEYNKRIYLIAIPNNEFYTFLNSFAELIKQNPYEIEIIRDEKNKISLAGKFWNKKIQVDTPMRIKKKDFDEAISKINLISEEFENQYKTKFADILTAFVNVLYYDVSITNPEVITQDLTKKVALGKRIYNKDIFVICHRIKLPKEILIHIVDILFRFIDEIPYDEMQFILGEIKEHVQQNNREIGGCIIAEIGINKFLNNEKQYDYLDVIQLAKERKSTLQSIGQLGIEIANVIGLLLTYNISEFNDGLSFAMTDDNLDPAKTVVFSTLNSLYLDIEDSIQFMTSEETITIAKKEFYEIFNRLEELIKQNPSEITISQDSKDKISLSPN